MLQSINNRRKHNRNSGGRLHALILCLSVKTRSRTVKSSSLVILHTAQFGNRSTVAKWPGAIATTRSPVLNSEMLSPTAVIIPAHSHEHDASLVSTLALIAYKSYFSLTTPLIDPRKHETYLCVHTYTLHADFHIIWMQGGWILLSHEMDSVHLARALDTQLATPGNP